MPGSRIHPTIDDVRRIASGVSNCGRWPTTSSGRSTFSTPDEVARAASLVRRGDLFFNLIHLMPRDGNGADRHARFVTSMEASTATCAAPTT
jgi:hypothetical protein